MTFFRRFFLDQSILEFDPIEMMFTCLYVASKIEEIQFDRDFNNNINTFVAAIKAETYCTVESKHNRINFNDIELTTNEIFLVKALKFQFVVYTPFELIDLMIETVVNEQEGNV